MSLFHVLHTSERTSVYSVPFFDYTPGVNVTIGSCGPDLPESLGCSLDSYMSVPFVICRCVTDYCNMPRRVPPTRGPARLIPDDVTVSSASISCYACNSQSGVSCDSPSTCVGLACTNTTLSIAGQTNECRPVVSIGLPVNPDC